VESPMETRTRRAVRVAEEEGRVEDFVTSAGRWGINHMNAQGKKISALGVED
ncbi:hypothetical protein A2U01_0096089, partial [Trifolium medium]|nr:hypothetical protein [Trifolium medium]